MTRCQMTFQPAQQRDDDSETKDQQEEEEGGESKGESDVDEMGDPFSDLDDSDCEQ